MASEYQSCAGVDRVAGAVGPLFYAMVIMVDPGSSATRISFEQFKKIGQQARILIEELLLTPRL